MTDQTTQTAVVETKTPAVPGAEVVQDARTDGDDLDTLLKEYDTTTAPAAAAKPAQPGQAGTGDLKALADEVKGLRTERQQETFRRDMDATIKNVRGDLDSEFFDDRLVEAYVNARANEDPRLATAWVNRHANPKQFDKVVTTLGREFAKKFGTLPDRQATEDREAVTAAVRGSSSRAPVGQAPSFGTMSDREFQAEKDKMLG